MGLPDGVGHALQRLQVGHGLHRAAEFFFAVQVGPPLPFPVFPKFPLTKGERFHGGVETGGQPGLGLHQLRRNRTPFLPSLAHHRLQTGAVLGLGGAFHRFHQLGQPIGRFGLFRRQSGPGRGPPFAPGSPGRVHAGTQLRRVVSGGVPSLLEGDPDRFVGVSPGGQFLRLAAKAFQRRRGRFPGHGPGLFPPAAVAENPGGGLEPVSIMFAHRIPQHRTGDGLRRRQPVPERFQLRHGLVQFAVGQPFRRRADGHQFVPGRFLFDQRPLPQPGRRMRGVQPLRKGMILRQIQRFPGRSDRFDPRAQPKQIVCFGQGFHGFAKPPGFRDFVRFRRFGITGQGVQFFPGRPFDLFAGGRLGHPLEQRFGVQPLHHGEPHPGAAVVAGQFAQPLRIGNPLRRQQAHRGIVHCAGDLGQNLLVGEQRNGLPLDFHIRRFQDAPPIDVLQPISGGAQRRAIAGARRDLPQKILVVDPLHGRRPHPGIGVRQRQEPQALRVFRSHFLHGGPPNLGVAALPFRFDPVENGHDPPFSRQ